MTRAASGDTVTLKPANNVYTALVAAGTLAVLIALVVLLMKAHSVAPEGSIIQM